MVIDTHTHAWGPSTDEHPWVNDELIHVARASSLTDVYTADTLISDMDTVGIAEAVLVGFPICDWRDNWYTVNAVQDHDRLYGIVMVDPFEPNADEILRDVMSVDGILGVRLGVLFPYESMWRTADPETSWLLDTLDHQTFWNAAVETDAVIQMLVHYEQLDQALALADKYPSLTYIIDHMARVDPSVPLVESEFTVFEDLAAYENVIVKLSALPYLSDEGFPFRDVHEHAAWLLNVYGRERTIWGSDYQVESEFGTYDETLQWLDHLDGLSRADRRWITERTFERNVL